MSIQRLHTSQRMSQIVIHQGCVYLAGKTADDTTQNCAGQTHSTLEAIEKLLIEVGSDKTRILSVTIYLKEIETDFAAMNSVWDAWLPNGAQPARATVEARMCEPDILVEMSVVAAI